MQLRLATFNVESLDDRVGHLPALDRRIDVLRPQLEQLRADVLCLQEVNGQLVAGSHARCLAALEAVLEGTEYSGFNRATTVNHTGHLADVHNLVTLSRWPIGQSRQFWNDLVPPLSYGAATCDRHAMLPISWDRPVLYTSIQLGTGKDLHIFNVHLRAPIAAPIPGQRISGSHWQTSGGWAEGYFIAAMKRSGQALEARLAVDGIFDREAEARVAVLGDFNSILEETPPKIIAADTEHHGNPELGSKTLHPLVRDLARPFSVLHDGRRLMYDHIFVSRAIRRSHCETRVENRDLRDEVRESGALMSGVSFHAPVVAEFTLAF